jgi:cytochrome P450
MSGYAEIDYFTDPSLVNDPYPYFEFIRGQGPAWREPHHGVVAVPGYDDVLAIFRDTDTYSSCNSPCGPFPPFPAKLEGDDVSALIEKHRSELPLSELLVTFDPPKHALHRALLMRIFTPRRLQENEAFMRKLADRQIDALAKQGRCEFIGSYSKDFTLYVIADLLGVPESEHAAFGARLASLSYGPLGEENVSSSPVDGLAEWFTDYVAERRRNPREGDVLSMLATSAFPDGSTPEIVDIVRIACFLISAGQDTTARLLASALRFLTEQPELQQLLREHPDRIPDFVEECLRLEGPTKTDFRMARVTTEIGGSRIPAGTTVMLLLSAANRDPARFERPHEFLIDRPNAREHLAFARGIHTCPGAALARVEMRISLERLLHRLADIRLDESQHGPPNARRFDYEPTFLLRGLTQLHLEYTAVA